MALDSQHFRKLAALSRQLADDCYSTEAREALLRTASEMDRKAVVLEQLQEQAPTSVG